MHAQALICRNTLRTIRRSLFLPIENRLKPSNIKREVDCKSMAFFLMSMTHIPLLLPIQHTHLQRNTFHPNPSLCLRKLTPRPQLGPHEIQRKDAKHPQETQPSQHTDALPDAHVQKQRSPKQDTPTRESGPEEIVAGEQTGCVFWVG